MADKYVLCRRDVGPFGERVYCAKPIKKPNPSNLCPEHLARLPFWPTGEAAPIHHCDPVSPCPVLIGAGCEGPEWFGAANREHNPTAVKNWAEAQENLL